MAKEIIKTYTEGDTTPNLVRTLPSATGIPNLTGATARLRIKRPDGVTRVKTITDVLSADGHIDGPTATPPTFFFIFASSDLVAGNLQKAEIEYTTAGGAQATERDIFFDVGKALG